VKKKGKEKKNGGWVGGWSPEMDILTLAGYYFLGLETGDDGHCGCCPASLRSRRRRGVWLSSSSADDLITYRCTTHQTPAWLSYVHQRRFENFSPNRQMEFMIAATGGLVTYQRLYWRKLAGHSSSSSSRRRRTSS
jgi:hypothetical protein